MRIRHVPIAVVATALLAANASALDILVTNDDGIGSEGLQVLAAALAAAGHDVTVVAPAEQQSGQGGAINTDVFTSDFIPVVRVAANQWSVAGTPSDAVNAALNLVMVGDPPDLVVSGLNEGQNLGKLGGNTSGTIGAALRAALGFGIPAIAGSVGILFAEAQLDPPFPSTSGAYPAAAAFIVDVVAALEAQPGAGLMPKGTRLLNVNFPVPVESWTGARVTVLADEGDLDLPFFDVTQGFPPFFPALPIAPPCSAAAVGEACLASVGVVFGDGSDAKPGSDVAAYSDGHVSITPLSGDMTAGFLGLIKTWHVLHPLLD